jgi:superfamily I DNA/RNA helicase
MPLREEDIAAAVLAQQAAAHASEHEVRVVAGPGTGKSFTIEERARWLLEQGVQAREILVVSFTRASSADFKATHLIVDEYQDLNPADLSLIDHLVEQGLVLFAAGDDDQSVYSFRYADPGGIQQFTSRHPASTSHVLKDCFRCPPAVTEAAKDLIQRFALPGRIAKELDSLWQSADPVVAGSVRRWSFSSGTQEAAGIASSCASLIEAGLPASEVLILICNKRVLEQPIP